MRLPPERAWPASTYPGRDHFGGVDRPVPERASTGRWSRRRRWTPRPSQRPAVDHEVGVAVERGGRRRRRSAASARRGGWRSSPRSGPARSATARTRAWSGTRSPMVCVGLAEVQPDARPAGQHQRERSGPEAALGHRRRRRRAPARQSDERLLGVGAQAPAMRHVGARRPLQASNDAARPRPSTSAARRARTTVSVGSTTTPPSQALRQHRARSGRIEDHERAASAPGDEGTVAAGEVGLDPRRRRARRPRRAPARASPWVSPISTTSAPAGREPVAARRRRSPRSPRARSGPATSAPAGSQSATSAGSASPAAT